MDSGKGKSEVNGPIVLLHPGETKRKSGVSVVPKVWCPDEQIVGDAEYRPVLPWVRIGNSGTGAHQPVFLSALRVILKAAMV